MYEIESTAQEINQLHGMVSSKAYEAMECARKAGELLLEVKSRLKHGKFLIWVNENLDVGIRQAQRYMNVALNKSISLQALTVKNDKMSHLTISDDQGTVVDGKWIPRIGYNYVHTSDDAAYWVVQDLNSNGFHVSKLYSIERDPNVDPSQYADPDDPDDEREWDGMSVYDGTKHPISSAHVAGFLKHICGLKDPSAVLWDSYCGKGYARPFGEPADSASL